MTVSFKDRVKQAITAGGTGAITLGLASTGYQSLGAADDGLLFPYVITDVGGAWETGTGTYTNSATSFARTNFKASSTGSALSVTTAAVFFVDIIAATAAAMESRMSRGEALDAFNLPTFL